MGLVSRREVLGVAASAAGGSVFTSLGGDEKTRCPKDEDVSVETARSKTELLAHILQKHCLAIERIEVTVVAMEDDFIVWVEFSTEEMDHAEAISVFKTTVKVFKWYAEDHDAFTEAYFSHDMERSLYANYTVKRAWTQLPPDLLIEKARTTYQRAG